jgi:hypothetical protein
MNIMNYITNLLMQYDQELHFRTHVILTNMAYVLVSDLIMADK